MEEKNKEVLQDKEVKLKGVDTIDGNEDVVIKETSNLPDPTNPPKKKSTPEKETTKPSELPDLDKTSSFLDYVEPKTEKEAFEKQVATSLGTPGRSSVKGSSGLISEELLDQAMSPVNLGNYIPDAREREKFLNEEGKALFQLDETTYGITFENEIEDLMEFKRREYPKRMKRFLDQLDENQGFATEMFNMSSRFLGSTTLAVSSIIPTIFGLGNAVWEGDSSKIFDNVLFDGWESAQEALDKGTVIYGGSDIYNYDPETGEFHQKEFFARFWNDPIKSMNQDVIPAASFVAGAVVTELLAGAVSIPTGGTALAGNTARLATQAKKLFSGNKFYNSSMKAIKGLDDNVLQFSKLKNSAQFKKVQQSLNQAAGTAWRGYRSAAYESALIARDTQERTLNSLLIEHHKNNGGEVNEEGYPIGEMIEPDKATLAAYEKQAASAGEVGYFMNVPLVAGSNFVQFPKLMMRNHALSNLGAKSLGKYSLKGTRYVDGKAIANVDANKYLKALGYTTNFLKRPIAEGWEEFAQEAMEEGLVDYYAATYSKDSAHSYVDMMSAIVDQASTVLSTTEGRDAVTIGALMGMLGLKLPVKVDQQTNKLSFSLKGLVPFSGEGQFGGSFETIKESRKKIETAQEKASILNKDLNEHNINPTLANNFRASLKHIEAQKNMDSAAIKGDLNEYKHQEHKQLFAYVYNKMNQELEQDVLNSIAEERKVSLEDFNKKYSRKDEQEFTEETKKEAIDKAETRVKSIIDNVNTIKSQIENNEHTGINKIGFALRKLNGDTSQKPLTPAELHIVKGMQEQIAYLYSSVENSKEREQILSETIQEKTKRTFDIGLLDAIQATPKGIKIDKETGKEEILFESNAKQVVNSILQEWKKQNPEEYNLHSESIKAEMQDIVKLKIRRARAAAMYKGMFTYKGAKAFREFSNELVKKHNEEINQALEKKIKEKTKKAKNANINKVAENERSIFGDSEITDKKILNDIEKGIKEYDNLNTDALSPEGLFQEISDILDKYPGLLGTLIKEGIKKGLPFQGIKTAKEISLNDTEDRALEAGTLNLIRQISKEWKEFQSQVQNQPEFDNVDDYDQPTKGNEITEGTTETNTNNVEKLDPSIHKEENLFVNVNEKALEQIEGKWMAVRDKDGKAVAHPMSKREAYKVNFEKVNSPAFLNNEVLEKENHEFEFRIPEDNEWNQRQETTTNDLWIDVVHVDPITKEETVIGNLEAYREGSPQHLKNLREEIVRRQELIDNQTENTELSKIKNKKKEVKEKLQELQQEAKEVISKEEESTTQSNEAKTSDTFDVGSELSDTARSKLNKLGFTDAVIKEMSKEDIELAKTFTSIEDAKSLLSKYEVTDVDTQSTPTEIQKKIEKLKSELSSLNEQLIKESNKDLNFKIESDNQSSIKLISKIVEYSNIKNKKKKEPLRNKIIEEFGEAEFERVNAIESNFNSIVEQIAASGINIFTPKDSSNKFQEC